MKTNSDPLDLVRESRIKMSHEAGNNPAKMIAILRKQEIKYASQIDKYNLMHAKVAEKPVDYGE